MLVRDQDYMILNPSNMSSYCNMLQEINEFFPTNNNINSISMPM